MTNPKDSVGAKKAPLSVVPVALMIGAAQAMKNGADKYGAFNWREQPVQAMTYVEAILRHLFAWVDGQDEAEDTGIDHFGHAAAGLGILMDAKAGGNLLDNRPTAGPAADMLRAQDKSAKPQTFYGGTVIHDHPDLTIGKQPEVIVGIFDETGQYDDNMTPFERIMGEIEAWGTGDGPVYGMDRHGWDGYGGPVHLENRGDWPPDYRVAGRLTCCGASEHVLECPQYR